MTKIIEEASGTPFHQHARSFFDRIGMERTEFNKNYMGVISHVALPYSDWGDGIWQQYPHLTNLYGDGFLYTTLNDQLTYELAIQQAEETDNELLTLSQNPIQDAEITSYGFGLRLGTRNGRNAIHHDGATGSYHAQVVRFPEENLSIVIMSNNNRIWSGYVADKIASVLLSDEPNEFDNAVFDNREYANALPSEAMIGEYVNDNGFIIRIHQKNDTLQWRSGNRNPLTLLPESGSVYQFAYNPKLKVVFKDKQIVVHEPDTEPQVHNKLPAFSPDDKYKQQLTGSYYNEELDITYRLSLDETETLTLYSDARDRSYTLEIMQRDFLQFSDYSISVQRNKMQAVESLLLSFSRLRNIRFKRIREDPGSK